MWHNTGYLFKYEGQRGNDKAFSDLLVSFPTWLVPHAQRHTRSLSIALFLHGTLAKVGWDPFIRACYWSKQDFLLLSLPCAACSVSWG